MMRTSGRDAETSIWTWFRRGRKAEFDALPLLKRFASSPASEEQESLADDFGIESPPKHHRANCPT